MTRDLYSASLAKSAAASILVAYEARDRYVGAHKALMTDMAPVEIVDLVKEANLRGRGGRGVGTGRKVGLRP